MSFFGTLFGGDQAKAAEKAAGIQQAGAKRAENLTLDWTKMSIGDLENYLKQALSGYDSGQSQAVGALQPFANAGTKALGSLQDALGLNGQSASSQFLKNFRAGPGYQFSMGQGVKALDQSAAAKGGLYSGAAGKALTQFGSGLADQEFGGNLDRLSGLVSGGQNASSNIANIIAQITGQKGAAIQGTGQNIANVRQNGLQSLIDAITGGANAQAGGVIGAANARSAGWGNLLSLLGGIGKFALGGFGGAPA